MAKEIVLSQGKVAIVDDEDFERVNAFKWTYDRNGYGMRMFRQGDERKRVMLHRFILDAQPGTDVDHINHDKLDNRRSNIRLCTRSQNNANSRPRAKHGYRGISKHKTCPNHSWNAVIRIAGKSVSLGYFSTPEEAARAYDKKAFEVYGEFAYLNFPHEVLSHP